MPGDRAVAETVNERRQLFQTLFVQLGIDPARAAADACNLEHAISSESFAALRQYLRRTLFELSLDGDWDESGWARLRSFLYYC